MKQRVEHIYDATLWLGDARELVPTLNADVVVSDPPYGIGFRHGGGGRGLTTRKTDAVYGDAAPFDPAMLLAWPCVLFGGNHFYARLPDGGTFHTWDKSCGIGPADSFSDAEYAWTSWRRKSEVFRYLWKGVLQDGEKGKPKYHIMQKPIAVMGWCLGFVPEAERILDPYMGSGSTGVACVLEGRKFIGIEIEPKYFDIACRRVEEAYRQPRLFSEPQPQPRQEALFEESA